jgi:hypothetical protein
MNAAGLLSVLSFSLHLLTPPLFYPPQSFLKVDTTLEELQGLSDELGVKALPAFKFYRGGKEAVEQVGGWVGGWVGRVWSKGEQPPWSEFEPRVECCRLHAWLNCYRPNFCRLSATSASPWRKLLRSCQRFEGVAACV